MTTTIYICRYTPASSNGVDNCGDGGGGAGDPPKVYRCDRACATSSQGSRCVAALKNYTDTSSVNKGAFHECVHSPSL
jgi:hypothetical protein